MADEFNSSKLNGLKTDRIVFKAETEGEFKPEDYPTDSKLVMKVGAQVMFIKNDKNKRWVNGTIGHVIKITDSDVEVLLIDGTLVHVGRDHWDKVRYRFNHDTERIEQEVIGTFEQYPLMLAWATTFRKSQSQTFERAIVDIGGGTFCSGQPHLALSRGNSWVGPYLKNDPTIDFLCGGNLIEC